MRVTRGDIVAVADRAGPAVVLQSPLFGDTVPLPVCMITSTEISASLLRVALPLDAATGLERPSWAMVEGITTIRQRRIGRRIGRLEATTMLEISRALLVFLGIANAAE